MANHGELVGQFVNGKTTVESNEQITDGIAIAVQNANTEQNELLREQNQILRASSLPEGFMTVVGEGGATLSGGEKQRISIARCILKDAPIVILDEATASVDTDNESYIQEAITELVKGKTLLVIAHRLNTIRSAEQILVIRDGRIVERGTHDQLVQTPGIYQDFVRIQEKAAGWSLV